MYVWWSAVAWSAPAGPSQGFWHPDDLAPLSAVYASSSEQLQIPFGDRSGKLERAARALREYREALDLLGPRAPAAERERLERLEQQFQRDSAVLQAFADEVVGGYDQLFLAAVDRAVAGVKGDVVRCAASVPTGPAMPGIPGRTKPNPDCAGRDLNADLAKAVDADPVLRESLAQILTRPWPEVGMAPEPQAAIPFGTASPARWLSVQAFVSSGAAQRLRAIDRADDDARESIEAAIEAGASVEDLKRLGPEAARIEAETAAKRAAVGAPALAAAQAHAAKRWSAEPATGWCANPAALGGCVGQDASPALIDRLVADKKVAKTFSE